jgi:hypothetical protein
MNLYVGTLSPTFDADTTSYTASVPYTTNSTRVRPTKAASSSAITVNGATVSSGYYSSAIPLSVGANTIDTVVTANDGTTTKTYTVTVTRAAPSTTASLSDLSLNSGTLSPTFSSGTTSYTASVANSVTSLRVTPTLTDTTASIKVNGSTVSSGNQSQSIPLDVGPNTITTVVTAEDGTTTETYTVTVTRAVSTNAELSNLGLSAGTLSPTFSDGTMNYTASVSGAVTSLTVTPTLADTNATVTVNGNTVTSGMASGAISLNVGANTLTILVTAQDGTTTNTYIVEVTRAVPGVIAFTPASGALPNAMAGEAYKAGITTTAVPAQTPIFSLSAGALPAGLTLNVSTGELTGPLAANSVGDYSFTITGQDSMSWTGSASYTLKVVPRAVTVADKTQDVPAGSTPPTVYLNRDATGGPFTNAEVVTVEPASAGKASIIQGELAAAGPASGPFGYYLKFIPNPSYSGSAKIGYKLVSALGISNVGFVTYNVAYDPAAVAADIDRKVHDFVRARQNLIASNAKVPGLLERRRMAKSTDGVRERVSPNDQRMSLGVATSLAELRAAKSGGAAAQQAFNVWVDGTLMAHKRDETEKGDWGSFGMLSVGADYLLSSTALIGASLHLDHMVDPTDDEAELKGDGWLAGPYASIEILRGVFFDTNLLYGGSSNDIDTAFFDGSFDTDRWMWSAKIAGQWQADQTTTITPKLRTVYLSEEVEDYGVANAQGDQLIMRGFTEEQFRVSVGADFEKQYLLESGLLLTPSLGFTAGVAALDNSGLFGSVTTGIALSDGMNWELDAALLFNLESDDQVGTGGKLGGTVRF